MWSTDGSLTGINTLGQSEPGSNGNKGLFHTHQMSRIGISPWDRV